MKRQCVAVVLTLFPSRSPSLHFAHSVLLLLLVFGVQNPIQTKPISDISECVQLSVCICMCFKMNHKVFMSYIRCVHVCPFNGTFVFVNIYTPMQFNFDHLRAFFSLILFVESSWAFELRVCFGGSHCHRDTSVSFFYDVVYAILLYITLQTQFSFILTAHFVHYSSHSLFRCIDEIF